MEDIYELCMWGNLMVNMVQYSENLFIVWEEWKRQISKQFPMKGVRREQSYDAFSRRKSWGSRAESHSEKVRGKSRSPAAFRNLTYSSRQNVNIEGTWVQSTIVFFGNLPFLCFHIPLYFLLHTIILKYSLLEAILITNT